MVKSMKNNGFTMVELLATITILAIIIVLAVPAVNSVSESIRESNKKSLISAIEKSLISYINSTSDADYSIDSIKPENKFCTKSDPCKKGYSISKLVADGIYDNNGKEVIDPTTNKKLEGCIYIKYNIEKHTLESEYSENNCN